MSHSGSTMGFAEETGSDSSQASSSSSVSSLKAPCMIQEVIRKRRNDPSGHLGGKTMNG